MKKWSLFLSLYACVCLLAACVSAGTGSPAPGGTPSNEAPSGDEGTQPAVIDNIVDEPPWFATFRIVSGAETGNLLLAENGEAGTGIYTLNTQEWTFEEPLQNGQLIHVYFETILETYPAQFSGVSAIELAEGGFDDRCTLYLGVLEDLWEVDSGLNDGLTYIGVDLSETSLTPAEQAAVSWAFAGNHGSELIQGTWDELVDQGYITASSLCIDTSEASPTKPDAYFYEWKDGCHFSITEQPIEGTYSLTPVTFDAQKWRSSLGAYWFCGCTSLQSASGKWGDYHIESEVIS